MAMSREVAEQIAHLLNTQNKLTVPYTAPRILEHEDRYLTSCDESAKVIGAVEVKKVQWYQCEIDHVSVDPGHKRHGVGSALLEAAEERARQLGARVAQCTIRVGNVESDGLFKKKGYTGTVTFRNADSGNDVTVYQRVLGAGGQQGADVRSVYGALVQLGIHGQENKWWMLYIVLMFNSILLLSCAALFGAAQFGAVHKALLCVFAGGGVLIDICLIVMAADYVKASNLYSDEIVEAEKLLPAGYPRPLTKRTTQRAAKTFLGTSEFIAYAVPAVLIVMYVILVLLSLLCR